MSARERDSEFLGKILREGYELLPNSSEERSFYASEEAVSAEALKRVWKLIKQDIPIQQISEQTGISLERLIGWKSVRTYLAFMESEHKTCALVD